MRHGHGIMRLITDTARARLGVDLDDEIEFVLLCCPFTKLQHFGKLIGGVDVQNGKRNLSKKRFAREPDENVGILAHRPRHGDVLEGVICLAKNENALVLEFVEMGACRSCHRRRSIQSRS